jgi:hypothetical protein
VPELIYNAVVRNKLGITRLTDNVYVRNEIKDEIIEVYGFEEYEWSKYHRFAREEDVMSSKQEQVQRIRVAKPTVTQQREQRVRNVDNVDNETNTSKRQDGRDVIIGKDGTVDIV